MENASGELKVDTEQLSTLGTKLTTTDFGEELTSLQGKMSTIQGSWLDAEGSHFSTTFASFIKDAQKITQEIKELGTFASDMAAGYEEIVTTRLEELKRC